MLKDRRVFVETKLNLALTTVGPVYMDMIRIGMKGGDIFLLKARYKSLVDQISELTLELRIIEKGNE